MQTNMKKSLKVYEVVYAEIDKNIECFNVTSKTVLAEDAAEAIAVANDSLTKKEKKTFYVESVSLIAVID